MIGCDDKSADREKAGKVVSQKIATGTGGKTATAAASKQPVKAGAEPVKELANAEAVPTVQPPEEPKYIPDLAVGYDPKGKIDPFVPLIRDEPVKPPKEAGEEAVDAKGQKRKKRVPQTPLEKIELNQLRLRAIILAPSGNRALVEESSGKGYILTQGTYIGRNQGTVTKILKDKVIVEEVVESLQGDITTQEKELKLPKPPGEE